MSYQGRLWTSVAVATLLATGAARANLSAESVWQAWKDYATDSGQDFATVAETLDGDTLTVVGLVQTIEADEIRATVTFDELVFAGQDDGTVLVTMSDPIPIVITDEDGEDEAVLMLRQPGLRLVASEVETGISYALQAPELALTLEEPSDAMPGTPSFSMTALGMTGEYLVPSDLGGSYDSSFRIASANLLVKAEDDFSEVDIDYTATGIGLDVVGTGFAAPGDDIAAALRDGLSTDITLSADTLRYDIMSEEWGNRTEVQGASMNGEFRLVMNRDVFEISSGSRNAQITLAGSDMPVESVTISFGQALFGVALPVMASPAAQDFSFLTRLVDVTMSDDVWSLFDPMGQLARSPVTAIIDLAGKVTLKGDLFDEDTAMGGMMVGPQEVADLEELSLNELLVRFAGAELTGDAGFTFDNTDLDSFDGLPRPTGRLDLALRGGNALLDTLVSMGMVPEDQAMGARMMLALFTRPGDGPDEVLTTLEVREDGAILANGQRIQ